MRRGVVLYTFIRVLCTGSTLWECPGLGWSSLSGSSGGLQLEHTLYLDSPGGPLVGFARLRIDDVRTPSMVAEDDPVPTSAVPRGVDCENRFVRNLLQSAWLVAREPLADTQRKTLCKFMEVRCFGSSHVPIVPIEQLPRFVSDGSVSPSRQHGDTRQSASLFVQLLHSFHSRRPSWTDSVGSWFRQASAGPAR